MELLLDSLEYFRTAVARSRIAVQSFEAEMEATGLPCHVWPRPLFQRFRHLTQIHNSDFRLFLKLQSTIASQAKPHNQAKPSSRKAAAEQETAEVPPAAKKLDPRDRALHQNLIISTVDGKTHTRRDTSNQHWLNAPPLHLCNRWWRHFYFETAEIPPEYAWVNEHEGLIYKFTQSTFILYEADEFLRLCQLELDTQSEHAIDGARRSYWRYRDADPIGAVEPFEGFETQQDALDEDHQDEQNESDEKSQ